MARYSVWVGGVEVNDFYLHEDEARAIANYYERLGYDDVEIEKIW